MMKTKLIKFMLLLTLALVSMSACYPSELGCADDQDAVLKIQKELTSTHHETKAASSNAASDDKENHHCLCSLTCHTLFISLSSNEVVNPFIVNHHRPIQYQAKFYPEISISFEKPPTV